MAVRTSGDHHSRLTNGDNIVLKKPRLERALAQHATALSGSKDTHSSSSSALDSIVRELRILSHPPLRKSKRILDVYGFAWELDRIFKVGKVIPILMVEHASNGTLENYLENTKPLPLQEKLKISSSIAEGLAALHKCRIVHSDLKPENVLVCGLRDGNVSVKLADFGLSVIIDETNPDETWSSGTLGWMAPEWQTLVPQEDLKFTDSVAF
ncbi:hypothetical protein K4F52_007534 [Lecanicillium sp. MT-2017a]|nr:hypothetical protein K4F52_007534 [Lecanicillium sp. MT-2017a]